MWKNIGAAMSLDKITFRGVETVQNQPEIKKEEPQKETVTEDKEKSNAAKYMIGAGILAGTIALGIIGHKNNWWRKVSNDAGEKIENKASEVLDEAASTVKPKVEEVITPKPKGTPLESPLFKNADGTLKNGSEAVDIIKDGKKTGIEIKEFKNGEVLSVTTKSLDESGNITKIEEFFRDERKTVLEKGEYIPTAGSERTPKKAWFYKEKTADGKEKSMRLVFNKDGTYTTNSMNMSKEEKNIVRAKLKEIGVVLRKTDEPILKGIDLINANLNAMEGKSGKEMRDLILATKEEIKLLENPEQKTKSLVTLLENIKKYAKPDDCDFVFNLEFEKGRNAALAKELIGFAQVNPEFEQKIIRGLLDSNCGCDVEEMTLIRRMLFERGLKPKGVIEGRGLVETDWGCTDTHFPAGRWLGFYSDKNLPKYKYANFAYDMSMGVEPKRAEALIQEITENAEAYEKGLGVKVEDLIKTIKFSTIKDAK